MTFALPIRIPDRAEFPHEFSLFDTTYAKKATDLDDAWTRIADEAAEIVSWLVDQGVTKSDIFHDGHRLYFRDAETAFHFKMRWM